MIKFFLLGSFFKKRWTKSRTAVWLPWNFPTMLFWQQSTFVSTISRAANTATPNSGRGNKKAEQLDKIFISIGLCFSVCLFFLSVLFWQQVMASLMCRCKKPPSPMSVRPLNQYCRLHLPGSQMFEVSRSIYEGLRCFLSHHQGTVKTTANPLCLPPSKRRPAECTGRQPGTHAFTWVLSCNICFHCTILSLTQCKPYTCDILLSCTLQVDFTSG